jgi:hypothetical protein
LDADYSKDFNFITDRLAIGCLASRSTPGFVAVVSVVTVEGRHRGRPWGAELTAKAPRVPGGTPMGGLTEALNINHFTVKGSTPVWIVDISDGEASRKRLRHSSECDRDPRDEEWTCASHCPKQRGHEDDRDLDFYLDDATEFIAMHIKRGCVLVHCGAGISRSAAVVIAYLCRFAGMSYAEALAFVKAKRPQVAPADVFKEAIERWLGLDKLATRGPRQGGGDRTIDSQPPK